MLENVGLGAIVKFDGSQAVSGMRSVSTSASSMAKEVSAAGASMASGFNQVGSVLGLTSLALAPFAAGVAFAGDAAAKFEQQMSAVAAVSGTGAEDMAKLTAKAKRLGVTTVFSAKEVGGAMEELARQGFDTNQILGATSGVVALAAADSISLETAALNTASALNAFGLEADKSNRVADVLAKASALSATNVTGLGEAMKFAAPDAKRLGIDISTTAAFLGALADNGIRGTLAGTAFKNAVLKLASPSEKATKIMKQYGIEIAKTADGSLDLVQTLQNVSTGFQGMDKMQMAASAKELFGMRGSPLLAAFESSRDRMMDDGQGNQVSKFGKMLGDLQHQFTVGGAATEMASKRLDNFLGQLTLLKRAVEGFSIETMSNFLPGAKDTLKDITKFVTDVTLAMQILSGQISKDDEAFAELGPTAVAVAKGISEGLAAINSAVETLKNGVKEMFAALGMEDNPEVIQKLAKVATIFVFLAAAAAPVLAALSALAFFVGAVLVPVFTVGLEAILAALGAIIQPILYVGLAIGAVLLVIESMRSSTETFGEAAGRVWNGIKEAVTVAVDWINTEYQRVMDFLAPSIKWMEDRWAEMKVSVMGDIRELVGGIIVAFEYLKPFFQTVFNFIGRVVEVFGFVAVNTFGTVFAVIGGIVKIVKELALLIIEGVVGALQLLAKSIVFVAKGLPGIDVPQSLKDFAEQPAFRFENYNLRAAATEFGAKEEKGFDILEDTDYGYAQRMEEERNKTTKSKAKSSVPSVEVAMDLTDNRKLDVNNCVNLDGRQIAAATAKNQIDVNERRGFKATPWQRRVIVEQGAMPVMTGQ